MKINYKLQTEKEDIKYYNQKVTKLNNAWLHSWYNGMSRHDLSIGAR